MSSFLDFVQVTHDPQSEFEIKELEPLLKKLCEPSEKVKFFGEVLSSNPPPQFEELIGISEDDMKRLFSFLPFQTIGLFVACGDQIFSKKKSCEWVHCRLVALRKILILSSVSPSLCSLRWSPKTTSLLIDLMMVSVISCSLELTRGVKPTNPCSFQLFCMKLTQEGSVLAILFQTLDILSNCLNTESKFPENSFYDDFLSSSHLGSFLFSLFTLWEIALEVFYSPSHFSKPEADNLALLLSLLLQLFSFLVLSSDFAQLLMFGDGNRISDSPSLVLWLITNVFQTLRLTPLVDLEDISWSKPECASRFPSSLKEGIQLIAMRLMVVLCEKEEPYFLDSVARDPFQEIINAILWLACASALKFLKESNFEHPVLLEYLRLMELCCDDTNFKPVIIEYVTPMVLNALSIPEEKMASMLSAPCPNTAETNILLFRIIGNLHCFNDALSRQEDKDLFLNECFYHLFREESSFVVRVVSNMGLLLNTLIKNTGCQLKVTPEDIDLFENYLRRLRDTLKRKGDFNLSKFYRTRSINSSPLNPAWSHPHCNHDTTKDLSFLVHEFSVAVSEIEHIFSEEEKKREEEEEEEEEGEEGKKEGKKEERVGSKRSRSDDEVMIEDEREEREGGKQSKVEERKGSEDEEQEQEGEKKIEEESENRRRGKRKLRESSRRSGEAEKKRRVEKMG